MSKLKEIYYEPENLWVGKKAIRLLTKASGLPKKVVQTWLFKQALFQVHLPRPKHIEHPHFQVTKVNKIHQADLMYLPHDKVYQTTYKYVLNVIDIASGYKASRPLKTKKASEIAEMFRDIYKKGPLQWPQELDIDGGSEFKSDVDKLMKEHNVIIKRVTTKYRHTFTAFAENFNKTLAQRLFKVQDAQELNDPTQDSKTWVKHLQKIIMKMNNSKLDRIGMSPAKAVKLEQVTLRIKVYPKEEILNVDGLYRYLYQPGELEGGQTRRATDMIWSWDTHYLDRVIEFSGQRVLYYLRGDKAPKRAFVREQLFAIPKNTELPPDHVKKW